MAGTSVNFIEQIFRNDKGYHGMIFLDRDGTINAEVDYLRGKMQLKILPKVVEAIRLLNKKKIAVVVITNQPVVARGYISEEEMRGINSELVSLLKNENAFIEAIYSCPHHPERDHADIPRKALRYRVKCECRKPGIAMAIQAVNTFGVTKMLGFLGDQTVDIMTAKNLGIQGILLKTGKMGNDKKHDVKPHQVYDNLLDAVSSCIDKLL